MRKLIELGRAAEAKALFEELETCAERALSSEAKIDYFATSLPNLTVFDEDLQARRDAQNHQLIAMANHGIGCHDKAHEHLQRTFAFTNADQHAINLAHNLQLLREN